MKKLFRTKNVLYGVSALLLIGTFWLFFDGFYGGTRFRTLQDKIKDPQGVDLTGLSNVQASGGNLPRLPYISWKLSHIKGTKIILDLKCGFHGYLKGFPLQFFGYRDNTSGIKHFLRRLLLTGTPVLNSELIVPESEEVEKYGFSYANITVGKQFIVDDNQLDKLISFLDNLTENSWIHVHCNKGFGRTSVVLAMLDIMKNAPQVTLTDIVKRQHLLGSVDLFDTRIWPKSTYTKERLESRKKFIENFYVFICQRKKGGTQLWSEWNRQRPEETVACASQSEK